MKTLANRPTDVLTPANLGASTRRSSTEMTFPSVPEGARRNETTAQASVTETAANRGRRQDGFTVSLLWSFCTWAS